MPLKLRPTGLGSGIDKDRADYTVVTGEWNVGRIYQTRGGPDGLRWFGGACPWDRSTMKRRRRIPKRFGLSGRIVHVQDVFLRINVPRGR